MAQVPPSGDKAKSNIRQVSLSDNKAKAISPLNLSKVSNKSLDEAIMVKETNMSSSHKEMFEFCLRH